MLRVSPFWIICNPIKCLDLVTWLGVPGREQSPSIFFPIYTRHNSSYHYILIINPIQQTHKKIKISVHWRIFPSNHQNKEDQHLQGKYHDFSIVWCDRVKRHTLLGLHEIFTENYFLSIAAMAHWLRWLRRSSCNCKVGSSNLTMASDLFNALIFDIDLYHKFHAIYIGSDCWI